MAPLQSDWVRERLEATPGEILEDIRLLLVDGSQIRGADIYRHLMRRIWWAYPLYLVACAPGLRGVFDWCYRTFAKNRFRFSSACGLKGGGNP